jgi:hypothetical protein
MKTSHHYTHTHQAAVEKLSREFWILMRSMLPMRPPLKKELRLLNWCEAATLCQELGGNGHFASDPWSTVERNCLYLVYNRILHIGHILALLRARKRL